METQYKLDQRHARNFLGFWTAIYALYLALTLSLLLDRVIRIMMWYSSSLTGFAIALTEILTPLVLVYSIWRMWSQYRRENYKQAYWATTYPIAFMVVMSCLHNLIS